MTSLSTDYFAVTEISGEEVTREQIARSYERYYWTGEYCRGKDVVELACGTGQGIGYLASLAKSFIAGDISPPMVERVRRHYGDRVDARVMDAADTHLADASADVAILFEAIYYLADAERFVDECRRILRPGGYILIATANKDLYDFNRSPYSFAYYGVPELGDLLLRKGFTCDFFGGTPVESITRRQQLLRPVKAFAVRFNLIPETMVAKKLLKRIVFGRLLRMPAELKSGEASYTAPRPVTRDAPDRTHKVIYCAARRSG